MSNSVWLTKTIHELGTGNGPTVQTGPFGSQLHAEDYVEEGVPFILIRNIGDGGLKLGDLPSISYSDAKRLARYSLKPGDIVFTRVGRAGSCLLVSINEAGWIISGQTLRLRLENPEVDNRFLLYALRSHAVQKFVSNASVGTTRESLNTKILQSIPVLHPKLGEQKRIAEILSTVDEAIEQTEALIAKYQQIKAGLMHDLFTRGITSDGHLRPTRAEAPHLYKESPLGWIPKEWEFATVGGCINGIDTGKSPDCPDTPASGDQWGVLKVGAIDPEGLREKENKVLIDERLKNSTFIIRPNDLLFSRANTVDLVGLVCHVTLDPGNLMLSDKTLRLKPITSLTTIRFLFYSLQTSRIRRQIENLATGTSGSMKNISQVGVESLRLVRPQPAEQVVITGRIDAWVDSINVLKGEAQKLRQQKHGLMHDLLTGRVRVKVAETASI